MREGTAKFADTTGENDRHLQKVFQKQVSRFAKSLFIIAVACLCRNENQRKTIKIVKILSHGLSHVSDIGSQINFIVR